VPTSCRDQCDCGQPDAGTTFASMLQRTRAVNAVIGRHDGMAQRRVIGQLTNQRLAARLHVVRTDATAQGPARTSMTDASASRSTTSSKEHTARSTRSPDRDGRCARPDVTGPRERQTVRRPRRHRPVTKANVSEPINDGVQHAQVAGLTGSYAAKCTA